MAGRAADGQASAAAARGRTLCSSRTLPSMARPARPKPRLTPAAARAGEPEASPPPRVRTFSADTATAALVYLAPVVADVQVTFRRVVRYRRLLDRAAVAVETSRHLRLAQDHQREMARLAGFVDEVQAVGAQLRDFEAGAVAFPSVDHGVPAGGYLSWMPGEEAVAHAHGPDEPTEARKPLRRKARRRAA